MQCWPSTHDQQNWIVSYEYASVQLQGSLDSFLKVSDTHERMSAILLFIISFTYLPKTVCFLSRYTQERNVMKLEGIKT